MGLTVFANPRRSKAAVLSQHVEQVRYRHAEDGKWYKHDFDPGASIELMRDGSARIRRKDGKPVWFDDSLDTKGDDVHFLINAPRRRRKSTRRPPKGFRTWKAYMDSIRPKSKKKKSSTSRRASRAASGSHSQGGTVMARRRRKRARAHSAAPHRRRRRHRKAVAHRRVSRTVRRRRRNRLHHVAGYYPNPRRRRRHAVTHRRRRSSRRYRRNAPFGLNFLIDAAKDGAVIVVAQVANRKVASLVNQYVPGLGADSTVGKIGAKVLSAAVIGLATRRFAPKFSRLATAAAMADAVTAAAAETPIAPYLGALPRIVRTTDARVAGYPQRSALPAARNGMNAWPRRSAGMPVQMG